ncbi:DNA methyltransferase 1-associated protein 1 family member [Anaeramoeba flamelloides]|uniref:DNA methyltransferase 1-associated protein 1 family member n=1 Tax=Anaeramoeba flamelloides TaxID=1746091 RepID=A0ABQ8X2Q0_9EUKA|nr:DNA methyltransferase 1-associated protein 1 family member [Anaeramoeba flamelloides]
MEEISTIIEQTIKEHQPPITPLVKIEIDPNKRHPITPWRYEQFVPIGRNDLQQLKRWKKQGNRTMIEQEQEQIELAFSRLNKQKQSNTQNEEVQEQVDIGKSIGQVPPNRMNLNPNNLNYQYRDGELNFVRYTEKEWKILFENQEDDFLDSDIGEEEDDEDEIEIEKETNNEQETEKMQIEKTSQKIDPFQPNLNLGFNFGGTNKGNVNGIENKNNTDNQNLHMNNNNISNNNNKNNSENVGMLNLGSSLTSNNEDSQFGTLTTNLGDVDFDFGISSNLNGNSNEMMNFSNKHSSSDNNRSVSNNNNNNNNNETEFVGLSLFSDIKMDEISLFGENEDSQSSQLNEKKEVKNENMDMNLNKNDVNDNLNLNLNINEQENQGIDLNLNFGNDLNINLNDQIPIQNTNQQSSNRFNFNNLNNNSSNSNNLNSSSNNSNNQSNDNNNLNNNLNNSNKNSNNNNNLNINNNNNNNDLNINENKTNNNEIIKEKVEMKKKIPTYLDWTKEETDFLLDLCEEFGLKFVVVYDRYNINQKIKRNKSIEELKERYYYIARKIINYRYGHQSSLNLSLMRYKYNRKYEERRTQQIERLNQRTQTEIVNEKELSKEIDQILSNWNEKKNSLLIFKNLSFDQEPKSLKIEEKCKNLHINFPKSQSSRSISKINQIKKDIGLLLNFEKELKLKKMKLLLLTEIKNQLENESNN